jgi:hypothetical protein
MNNKVERLGFSLDGADYEQGYIVAAGKFKANSLYRTTKPIFVEKGVKCGFVIKDNKRNHYENVSA